MLPVSNDYRNIFAAVGDGLIVHDVATGRVLEVNPAAVAMHGYSRSEFIGLHFTTYVHADYHHLFTTTQALPSHPTFEAIHFRREQSPFFVEVSQTALMYHGRPSVLSAIRDVTQRVQTDQQLRLQLEQHIREQTTLLEVAQTLASSLELQPGLILDELLRIVEYIHAGLFMLEENHLVALAVRGAPSLSTPFRIVLNGLETLIKLRNSNRPLRIPDVHSTDPAAQLLRAVLHDQAAEMLVGTRSWMWVPVAAQGRVIGTLGIAHREPSYFTSHHARLALTVANQAAITLINAELYENAQMLATIRERQRLAQELHDAVNQSLFSAGLIAEVLPRLWERDPAAGHASLADLRHLTQGALAEMRMLLVELRPSALTDSDLGDLLRLLGNAFMGRVGLPVNVRVEGQHKLLPAVQVMFYRLCQEALNNIAKHAEATQVDIYLAYAAKNVGVELRVRDNGRGFDPAQVPPGHYGLSMMYERAETVGAVLQVTSQLGHGTEVCVQWDPPPASP